MDEQWDNHWEQSGDDPNTSDRREKIQTLGTVGGPVTCVSLPQSNVCVYSQGSGLERIVWPVQSSATRKRRRDRTIVFENGTGVHGIRYSSNSAINNEQDEEYTAVFGGRQVAILRHVVPNSIEGGDDSIKPMEILPLMLPPFSLKQHQSKCMHFSNWIWDVQWIPTVKTLATQATRQNVSLLVGLAHNTVELWKFTAINANTMKGDAPCLEASRRTTWTGTKRCLLYCLDFSVTCCLSPWTATVNVAVGTAMQDIRIWQVACDITTPTPITAQEAIQLKDDSMIVKEQACLLGHQGVIHSVKWMPSSTEGSTPQLVSASDDRSIRLWGQQPTEQQLNVVGETEIAWHCLWVGWGHTARIWGLGILQQPTQTNHDNSSESTRSDMIVSTGEDGTARLWDSKKGTELAVFRGHSFQCVWSVGTNRESGIIVTGGNDGTVALHDAGSMASISTSDQIRKAIIEDEAERPALDMLLVPDDRPKVILSSLNKATGTPINKSDESNKRSSLSEPEKKKKKKKKQQPVGQIVVGMKFYDADKLLVATREGTMFSVHTSTATSEEDWITVGSWAVSLSEDGVCKSDKQVDPKGGCCMALYLDSDIESLWVAIGTSRGETVAMELSNVSDELKITGRTVLSTPTQYRSVQGLSWLPSSTSGPSPTIPQLSLLSFHINTILWWSPLCHSGETKLSGPLWVLQMETQAIPISFSFDERHRRFYAGDTRGNLVMFHLAVDKSTGEGNNEKETYLTLTPTSTLSRLHQKEHVTDIVAVPTTCGDGGSDSQRVLSVGNDGCIVESFFNTETGTLRSGLRVTASSALTGILQLWVVTGAEEESLIVSGYYGNTFVVINVTRGYEIFRIDTGGRQRQLDFYSPSKGSLPQSTPVESVFNLAINVHLKQDGRNSIMLHNATEPESKRETGNFSHQHPYALGVGLHGETIYSASLFSYINRTADSSGLALLSGSEDCGSKISFFENDTLVATKRLPPQESCVRAVCSSTRVTNLRHSTLLAVGGGKLTLQFFLVTAEATGGRNVQIFSIGHGKTREKNDIDHRINSVASMLLESPNGAGQDDHIVAAGDSQGNCQIYRVTADEDLQKRSWIGLPIPVEEAKRRPILSVELMRVGSCLLLMTGTTGGDIHLFDLPATTNAEEWNALLPGAQQEGIMAFPARRVGSFRAHQMGVNSVSTSLLLHQDSSSTKVRVCSGGDDQAISLCDIQIVFDAAGTKIVAATVLELKTYRESSSSAIKEVRMLDEKHVLSVGYSQRLALWKRSEEAGLELLWTAPASVGDINCLACARTLDDNVERKIRAKVAVCGAGVGLFSVDL